MIIVPTITIMIIATIIIIVIMIMMMIMITLTLPTIRYYCYPIVPARVTPDSFTGHEPQTKSRPFVIAPNFVIAFLPCNLRAGRPRDTTKHACLPHGSLYPCCREHSVTVVSEAADRLRLRIWWVVLLLVLLRWVSSHRLLSAHCSKAARNRSH